MTIQESERRRQKPKPIDGHADRVMTIKQWCDLNGICYATGLRLLERGEGPVVIHWSATFSAPSRIMP